MVDRSDHDLLMATHRGDHIAAASLFQRFAPRLAALARGLLRDHSRADDSVQAAFLAILSTPRASLADVRDVPAYLARCVRNSALNEIRSDARRTLRNRAATQDASVSPPAGLDAITPLVDALPDEQREVVLLRHVAGLSFDQIADCLDVNRNTIASRYRLALEFLRRRLQPAQEVSHAS